MAPVPPGLFWKDDTETPAIKNLIISSSMTLSAEVRYYYSACAVSNISLLLVQLEVLFKRSLHKLALDLAISHDAHPELVAAIRQRWGDHLYAKAEYEGAMAQYLETIGYLEPSYVIRRCDIVMLKPQREAAELCL